MYRVKRFDGQMLVNKLNVKSFLIPREWRRMESAKFSKTIRCVSGTMENGGSKRAQETNIRRLITGILPSERRNRMLRVSLEGKEHNRRLGPKRGTRNLRRAKIWPLKDGPYMGHMWAKRLERYFCDDKGQGGYE